MKPSPTKQPVDQALGAEGLIVAAALIELLAAVIRHLARPGDVVQFRGGFQKAQLAACYLLDRWSCRSPVRPITERFNSMVSPSGAA